MRDSRLLRLRRRSKTMKLFRKLKQELEYQHQLYLLEQEKREADEKMRELNEQFHYASSKELRALVE